MKLFISKEVLKNIDKKIKIRPLDLKRTRINMLNLFQKEDGSREITPFNFVVPVNSVVLQKSKDNILLDIYGLAITHKEQKKSETQNDNVIYAMLYQGTLEPRQIYVPVEQKDKIKVLYKIQNQNEWFYIACFNLNPKDSVPVYLAYEADFWVQKVLYFECSNNNELVVNENNDYFVINNKNRILYSSLSNFESLIIE